MTPSRWERIEELYHAALNQPARERLDFLGKACAGDSDLRREVESLLSEESNGERLLGVPAWYQAAPLLDKSMSRISTRLGEGEQLGPYRISCLIRAGGMGEVYRAKDMRLEREVAIKLLPRDH